jgi:AsmA protein
MGKLLKIILGLIIVVVLAAIIAPIVIDPNDHKDKIAAAVNKQTGRTLEIEGDIGLSMFPWLGLDIGPTRLSNATGFDEPYMASMETVQVRVKLLPLLKKQLEVDKLRLGGLQLNLAKDANGLSNWADLLGEVEAPDEKPDADAEKGPEAEGFALEGLAVEGIEVTDARLLWDDREADARYELNELSFTTGVIEPGEAFDLDLQFSMAATQPAVSGQFALSGNVLIAADLNAVDIKGARLQLDASGEGIPAGRMTLSLATDMALDLAAGTLSLPDLVLETLGLTVKGDVSGSGVTGDAPQFNGKLAVASFAPRDVITALGQAVPPTADSTVLGKADATLVWDASLKHFAATELGMHLDDTTLNGKARVETFEAPAITFDMMVDTFDLDRYLPPVAEATEGEAAPAAEDAPAGQADEPLPLEALRSLDLSGSLKVASLKAFNLKTSDVVVQVRARDGVVRVNPLGAKLYSGTYQGDVTLDARKDTPRISLNEKLSGVQAGPLMKDLTGEDTVLGTANVTAKLTAAGATADDVTRTLNGNTSFSFTDGAIKGVNIAEVIRKAQAKLKGQPVPEDNLPNQTDFASMSGTTSMTNGLVRNNDFSLLSPLLRLSGKGEVSLPQESIDYTLTTKIVGSLEGQGGKSLDELKGVAIPVHVGGTFSKPTYKPDLGAALSEAAKAKVEEKVEEQKQKLEEKLGDQLQDKLKGLFR